MKRKASIATAAVFLAVLFGFSLLHLALPDREVSRSERRRLAQLPPLSSGFSDKLEEYMLDQFPLREQLRTVNSLVRLYGLGQADIHGIYLQGGGMAEMALSAHGYTRIFNHGVFASDIDDKLPASGVFRRAGEIFPVASGALCHRAG